MWKPIHLVPPNTRIDFMRWHRFTFALAVIMTLASVGLLFVKGLNFGIDFAGGILMEVRVPQQEGGEGAQQTAIAKVRAQLGSGWDYRRTETVGPKVGSELVKNAVIA